MCHDIMCHAKVVHLLVMSCYDTDLHVMSRPFFSCPFSCRVMFPQIMSVMSCQLEQVHTCHFRIGQVKACQLKSFHVFAQSAKFALGYHCLALLLPDSLSVWASEQLKLSRSKVLALSPPRGICPLAPLDVTDLKTS